MWYLGLRNFLIAYGFQNSQSDASLFILTSSGIVLYVLVYVDDIVITGNDSASIKSFIALLGNKFSLKDMGALSYFLGIEAHRSSKGLLLAQQKYITDLLARTDMLEVETARPVFF